jgi:hypothetical protein
VSKTLAIYLMSGPDTPTLAEAAVEGGADLVELGFPFSDPLADGPVIRRAAEKALAQGMRTRACLECLAATRERVEVPLVPMTYSSLLEAYGWDHFAADARSAGAASLIVADLPAGDRPGLQRVQLVAPTSTDERLRIAARETDGWLYLVTVTGTTGARSGLSSSLARLAERDLDAGGCPGRRRAQRRRCRRVPCTRSRRGRIRCAARLRAFPPGRARLVGLSAISPNPPRGETYPESASAATPHRGRLPRESGDTAALESGQN